MKRTRIVVTALFIALAAGCNADVMGPSENLPPPPPPPIIGSGTGT